MIKGDTGDLSMSSDRDKLRLRFDTGNPGMVLSGKDSAGLTGSFMLVWISVEQSWLNFGSTSDCFTSSP